MKEIVGNIFEQKGADAICFTSNGIVRKDGLLVMGAGIAKAFKDRWPFLPERFGAFVSAQGNHVYCLQVMNPPSGQGNHKIIWVASLPTKHDWRNPSDISLIERSVKELIALTTKIGWNIVVLSWPGCGLGGLTKEKVRKVIEPLLDDRFYIITPK